MGKGFGKGSKTPAMSGSSSSLLPATDCEQVHQLDHSYPLIILTLLRVIQGFLLSMKLISG